MPNLRNGARTRLLLRTNRKSHTRIRLAPTSMTLDYLERLKRLSCRNKQNLWAHQNNFNEDRPILSAVKCRPMIVVSKNIFAGGDVSYNTCYRIPASKLHVSVWNNSMGVAYLQSWYALRSSACSSQCTTGAYAVDCTWLYRVNAYQGQ